MNTQILTEALRDLIPEELDWRFALYSTHKSRDGIELDWYLCKMKDVADWADTVRTAFLEKTLVDKAVAAYSPFLSDKEHIAAIEKESDLIKEQIGAVLENIRGGLPYAPEDFISGAIPKPTGFAFYGERKDEEGKIAEQALFMRRGSPFLMGQRVRLCTTKADEVVRSQTPVLKFTAAADFLFIGDVCYFNSASIEKDFELENRHLAIAMKRMALIADADIVGDYESLEEAAMSAKNARKFIDFDQKILEHIGRMNVGAREEWLSTYGVTVDKNGRMDTTGADQCELVIDLLCCRSCLDPLGRLSTGSNITPRE
ncbi:MAG: hypothetical protein FWF05_02420 [Oscillospiraceae bacterium]|nr:hypothetical protein [Oscillospiraceae bacterium]